MAFGAAGADIAIEAAYIALMREDWSLVPQALATARRTGIDHIMRGYDAALAPHKPETGFAHKLGDRPSAQPPYSASARQHGCRKFNTDGSASTAYSIIFGTGE